MIKIVIVDDDVLALAKLKSLIRLKNTRVVGEFVKPQEALDFLKDHGADILITDMRMPKVDGIALIRGAKEYRPQLEVIATSSYKDFEYVKESFLEGSVDYILKHTLDEDTLTQALLKAAANIRSRQKAAGEGTRETLEESRHALRSGLFARLLKGEIDAKEAAEQLKRHGIQFDMGSASLLVCELDDYEKVTGNFGKEDKRIFLNAVWDIMERIVSSVPEKEIIKMEENRYAVLLSFTDVKSQLYIITRVKEYGLCIQENLQKMMDIQVSVGMGRTVMDMKSLADAYQECLYLLKNKFFDGKGQIYDGYGQNVRTGRAKGKAVQPERFDGEEMYKNLTAADTSCKEKLSEIFESYKRAKLPIPVVEMMVVEMLNIGYRAIKEQKLEGFANVKEFSLLYQEIKRQETVDEIRDILLEFYQSILEAKGQQEEAGNPEYSKYTNKAAAYIAKHYKEQISLQELAQEYGIHYAYLSKVFREDTKISFSEYLNRYRIERAKELIAGQEYRIKEVYSQVGFNQYNYFFKVFKQQTGCTPLEYEKRAGRQEISRED